MWQLAAVQMTTPTNVPRAGHAVAAAPLGAPLTTTLARSNAPSMIVTLSS